MHRLAVVVTTCFVLLLASVAMAATKRTVSAKKIGFAYSKDKITVAPGKVTLKMRNPSNVPHSISIRGHGVRKLGDIVEQGGTSTVSAKLAKGIYTFYCHVGGHEVEGMKGRLIVK